MDLESIYPKIKVTKEGKPSNALLLGDAFFYLDKSLSKKEKDIVVEFVGLHAPRVFGGSFINFREVQHLVGDDTLKARKLLTAISSIKGKKNKKLFNVSYDRGEAVIQSADNTLALKWRELLSGEEEQDIKSDASSAAKSKAQEEEEELPDQQEGDVPTAGPLPSEQESGEQKEGSEEAPPERNSAIVKNILNESFTVDSLKVIITDNIEGITNNQLKRSNKKELVRLIIDNLSEEKIDEVIESNS